LGLALLADGRGKSWLLEKMTEGNDMAKLLGGDERLLVKRER
jgi:hypothetical protein